MCVHMCKYDVCCGFMCVYMCVRARINMFVFVCCECMYIEHTCGVYITYLWCIHNIPVVYTEHTCGVYRTYLWCVQNIPVV